MYFTEDMIAVLSAVIIADNASGVNRQIKQKKREFYLEK